MDVASVEPPRSAADTHGRLWELLTLSDSSPFLAPVTSAAQELGIPDSGFPTAPPVPCESVVSSRNAELSTTIKAPVRIQQAQW
jgi:hypothetical protein